MAEEQKVKLFREKSLEAVESPESLNDYLRVTSAGVWLVMAAVIMLLAGGLIWSIYGRIESHTSVAVASEGGQVVCYVPYTSLQKIAGAGSITIDEQTYPFGNSNDAQLVTVTDSTNPFLRIAGGLKLGDVIVTVPVEASLPDGVYTGTVLTERLQPISLLLQ